MWSISYGLGDDERGLPRTHTMRFAYATELFAHLDALRRGASVSFEQPTTEPSEEAVLPFSVDVIRVVDVGFLADHETEDGPAPQLHVKAQVGNAPALDLAEALVHIIGQRVLPGGTWAKAPPIPRQVHPPETWPLPEGKWGRWMIEWSFNPNLASREPGPWATGGMAWGDGVRPTPNWIDQFLTPFFSQPDTELPTWFEREIVNRRPRIT